MNSYIKTIVMADGFEVLQNVLGYNWYREK